MSPTEDIYRQKGLRKKLTESIRSKGITNEKVMVSIGKIPRHFFLDSAFDEVAYADRAFPIGEGQTILNIFLHNLKPQNEKKSCAGNIWINIFIYRL